MIFCNIIYIFLFSFCTFLKGENLQITKLMEMKMEVPVVGPVIMTFNQTVAPGFYKNEEKREAERLLFRWIGGDISGEIMIAGTDKIIKYDYADEEYWLESPKDYFAKKVKDTSNTKKTPYSFTFDFDDEDNPPKISRHSEDNIEEIHGHRTRKWITTIANSKKKMIIEEWYVKKLPLLDLHDSLKSEMISLFNPGTVALSTNRFNFTSDLILDRLDTLNSFETIPGRSLKSNFILYEGDVKPKFTISFQIIELYAESVDTAFFTIPEQFKKTVK